MSLRSALQSTLRQLLSRYKLELVPRKYVYDWQLEGGGVDREPVYLPPGAAEYLQPGNPRLISLQARYPACDYPCGAVSLWTADRVSPRDMLYFRGHNAYLFQEGRFNRNLFGYLLAYYYAKSIDTYGLLDKLEEDNAFGALTYQIDGRLVSRDLLDSILEIYFLDRHLGLFQREGLRVLDIGAGYGRLAHRLVAALPGLASCDCADAIPVSSFLAEYYLKFRGVADRARVTPLDTIRADHIPGSIDLALSIHCFSECTLDAVAWWLDFLSEIGVPYLMIVPNSGPRLLLNDREDFSALLKRYGYRQVALEPKYLDPLVQKYALNPDHHHLYALQ